MSYTEIYAFGKDGNAHLAGEIHNAWRGGMAVWSIMELRHLPPLPPKYGMECHRYSTRPTAGKENPMQEIWDLADNLAVPVQQRIVLFTTFDNCLVKKEDIHRVIEAFRSFEGDDHRGETDLGEQADILEDIANDPEIIAVGWNQTSIVTKTWSNYNGYDEEKDEPIPYNCLTGDKHYWLFDDLKEGGETVDEKGTL